jgi:hypothetical protein
MSIAEAAEVLERAEEVEWPEPEPILGAGEDARPYPLDALPPVMRKAVETYQRYGQQPLALVACSALANASLAVQGLVDVGRDQNLIGPRRHRRARRRAGGHYSEDPPGRRESLREGPGRACRPTGSARGTRGDAPLPSDPAVPVQGRCVA